MKSPSRATTLKTTGLQTLQDYRVGFTGVLLGPKSPKKKSWSDHAAQQMESFSRPQLPPLGSPTKIRQAQIKVSLGRLSSDVPDQWTNPERNKVKNCLSRMGSKDFADRMVDKASAASPNNRLQLSRSSSLPTVVPKQRQPKLVQKDAACKLNELLGYEHRNGSTQKSAADAVMRPNVFAQQQQRSCSAARRRPIMQTKEADNTDALGEFLEHWEDSLCAPMWKRGNSNFTRFNLAEARKLGEIDPDCNATPTTCSGSPASSRCSSSFSSHRAASYAKPENGIPYAAKLFALLDRDGNRLIDKDEWSFFFEIACKGSIFHDILRFLFKAADVDEDGKLDEHEWMHYVEGVIAKIGMQAWGEMANRVAEQLNAPRVAE